MEARGVRKGCFAPRGRRGLTLDQMRVFVAVAEREHVTRAAQDLALAQSATSAAIASLEAVLATRLFDKVGRNIKLTPAGRCLLPKARELVTMADEIVACCADPTTARKGATGAPARST